MVEISKLWTSEETVLGVGNLADFTGARRAPYDSLLLTALLVTTMVFTRLVSILRVAEQAASTQFGKGGCGGVQPPLPNGVDPARSPAPHLACSVICSPSIWRQAPEQKRRGRSSGIARTNQTTVKLRRPVVPPDGSR